MHINISALLPWLSLSLCGSDVKKHFRFYLLTFLEWRRRATIHLFACTMMVVCVTCVLSTWTFDKLVFVRSCTAADSLRWIIEQVRRWKQLPSRAVFRLKTQLSDMSRIISTSSGFWWATRWMNKLQNDVNRISFECLASMFSDQMSNKTKKTFPSFHCLPRFYACKIQIFEMCCFNVPISS